MNIEKFIKTPILNNFCKQLLHFWKVLLEHFSDHNLAKGTFNKTKMVTCCVKGCSNQSRLNTNVSYHKLLGKQKRFNSSVRGKPQLSEKFHQNWIKSRKYFLHASIKISDNFDINICDGTKQICPRNKKRLEEKILYEFQKQSSLGVL